MKLLVEMTDQVNILTESAENGKQYFLEGIFLQAGIKNRNGRIYPVEILEKEVERYQKNFIEKRKAWGELNHPANPSINLDRVSHMIVEVKRDGNNFIGKAQIVDTPMGKIVKSLMDVNGTLGVSSRGVGSLKESKGVKVVQNDFQLTTLADIVSDPSAPDAFPENLIENTDWFFDGIDWRKQEKINDIISEHKKLSKKDREEKFLKLFSKILKKL